MIIYGIKNKINGKWYIGQTVRSVHTRWEEHCKGKDMSSIIYLAIQKYGRENFAVVILDKASSIESLNQLEKEWVEKLNTFAPNGYNLTRGGSFIPSKGTRLKMSVSHKGQVPTAHTRAMVGIASKNRIWRIESKEKLSKLKAEQVRMIKYLLNEGVLSTTLASMYAVKPHIITDIKRGKTWRDQKALNVESNGVS